VWWGCVRVHCSGTSATQCGSMLCRAGVVRQVKKCGIEMLQVGEGSSVKCEQRQGVEV